MKKHNFPIVASSLGLIFLLVIIKGSEIDSDGATIIPLLSLLAITEFAFFVTAIGAYMGVRHMLSVGVQFVYAIVTLVCFLLSIRFMLYGITLWPL